MDVFTLKGSFATRPASGSPSGEFNVATPVDVVVALKRKAIIELDLTSDGVQNVDLGALAGINVLQIQSVGGKVLLRATSADGSAQAIPVDPYFSLITLSVPLTALSVERVAGTLTSVKIFLGERA
jgi:hypothetical protein